MKVSARGILALCSACLTTGAVALRADDVTDTIEEAIKAYNEKDYVMAAQSLETATQLVKQKRAERLTKFLPKAPSGWTASDASSQAAATSFFGGGVTADREYSKGDSTVTIKILTDSPLMQGVMMMMGNPMFANADGGKLTRLKGQRAIVKYNAEDKGGSINLVVGGAILVEIEGSDCTEADMMTFANAIDYAGLAGAL
ncbi:MAG TPA: hypothetical protein VGA56_09085 [Opitutaceae bacterium]